MIFASLTQPTLRHDFFPTWLDTPSGSGPPHCWCFEIALRHTTLGRTPLDEWSARRRDLYLTTHNTHKIHTSMTQAGLEPAIPSSERPHTQTFRPRGHRERLRHALRVEIYNNKNDILGFHADEHFCVMHLWSWRAVINICEKPAAPTFRAEFVTR
jgi:hypothetical protein